MPLEGNKDVIIDAVVTLAEVRGRAWLVGELERVTMAFMANKPRVKSLAMEGQSVSSEYEMSTSEAVEMFQTALERLDGKTSGEGDDMGCTILPRITGLNY
jgi:hypothetical protein